MSAAKTSPPHKVMKCGYICKYCLRSHIHENALKYSQCPATKDKTHCLIKKAFRCGNCLCLSDCAETFSKEACPGPIRRPESESEGTPPPKDPSPEEANAYLDLRMAELELNRLKLMKELQVEREKMQSLMLQKGKIVNGKTNSF